MAQVVLRETQGDTPLPEWGSEIPEKGVRDIPEPVASAPTTSSAGIGPLRPVASDKEEKKQEKKVWKDLDKF